GVGQNRQDHILLTGLCFEAKRSLPPPNNNLGGNTFFWKSRSELDVPDLKFGWCAREIEWPPQTQVAQRVPTSMPPRRISLPRKGLRRPFNSLVTRPKFVSLAVPLVSAEIGAQYPIPANAFCIVPGLVRPQSRGYLWMKTASHDGPLEIQPNFLKEQAD